METEPTAPREGELTVSPADIQPKEETPVRREDKRTRTQRINSLEKEIAAIKQAQTNVFVMKQGYGIKSEDEGLSPLITTTAKLPLDEKIRTLESLKAEKKMEKKNALQKAASVITSFFHI